ncbi:MAG TPA: hypothetical protein PLV52_00225 [Candidatus Omnitrophota bacterium]|nr:hypothetical protein [Candidatus Omnitrophota bacterium]
MKRSFIFAVLVCTYLNLFPAYLAAQESGSDNGDGRYQLHDVKIGNEMVPFLVDTRTGKVWMYQTDIGSRKKFVGISVDGIAYSKEERDSDALAKQIDQWHFNGFIDKTTKGLKENLYSQFGYDADTEKAAAIYNRLKTKRE